jgi:hypothetical protein
MLIPRGLLTHYGPAGTVSHVCDDRIRQPAAQWRGRHHIRKGGLSDTAAIVRAALRAGAAEADLWKQVSFDQANDALRARAHASRAYRGPARHDPVATDREACAAYAWSSANVARSQEHLVINLPYALATAALAPLNGRALPGSLPCRLDTAGFRFARSRRRNTRVGAGKPCYIAVIRTREASSHGPDPHPNLGGDR